MIILTDGSVTHRNNFERTDERTKKKHDLPKRISEWDGRDMKEMMRLWILPLPMGIPASGGLGGPAAAASGGGEAAAW